METVVGDQPPQPDLISFNMANVVCEQSLNGQGDVVSFSAAMPSCDLGGHGGQVSVLLEEGEASICAA